MFIDASFFDQLSNRVYIFSVNTFGFAKSLQKAGFSTPIDGVLVKAAGEISKYFLDLDEIDDKEQFLKHLNICKESAEISMKMLQKIEISDKILLNEKVDLTIESSELLNVFTEILNKNS